MKRFLKSLYLYATLVVAIMIAVECLNIALDYEAYEVTKGSLADYITMGVCSALLVIGGLVGFWDSKDV